MAIETDSGHTHRPVRAKKPRRKISVNLSPGVEEMLEEVEREKDLRTSEAVQEAIKVLSFITREAASGRRVFTISDDGTDPKELVFL